MRKTPELSTETWPLGHWSTLVLTAQIMVSLIGAVVFQSRSAIVLVSLDALWAVTVLTHVMLLRQARVREAMLVILAATLFRTPLSVLSAPALFPAAVLLPGLAVGYVLMQPQVFRIRTLMMLGGAMYGLLLATYWAAGGTGDLPRSISDVLLFIGIPAGALGLVQMIARYRQQIDATLRRTRDANVQLNRTRDQLSHLLEVSRAISVPADLHTLTKVVLDQLSITVECDSAAIFLVDADHRITHSRFFGGNVPLEAHSYQLRRPPAHHLRVLQTGLTTIVSDIFDRSPDTRMVREALKGGCGADGAGCTDVNSWIGVPLNAQGRTIGLLSLAHGKRWHFRAQHAQMALAFANQVAAVISSMQLKDQAVSAAALNERAHLARELHDSVSQALFGASLGVRTGLELLPAGSDRAQQPISYALDLVETALTEMRALIFELRPESLELDGLVPALKRQAAAVVARYKAEYGSRLNLQLCEVEPAISLMAKEAVYRISLEALQNAGKHARATNIDLEMSCDDRFVTVVIHDNGKGFDPKAHYPGHLGLITMRERAEKFGGTLDIDSAVGHGTRITVNMPVGVPVAVN